MDANVNGQLFIVAHKWIEETKTEEEKKSFYSKLSPDLLKKLKKHRIGSISPIEAKYYIEWVDAGIEVFGEQGIKAFSAYLAFENLSKAMRFLMKIGAPAFIAGNFPSAHKLYFNKSDIINPANNYLKISSVF